jgi:hypothetical protein
MRPLVLAAALALLAAPALAAPAWAQVEVSTLAAPDYFSLGERDTIQPTDLWRGTSPGVVRDVIPLVGLKPLSPAAAALARHILGAGVAGPEGAGRDPDVAAARIQALLRLGEGRIAWAAAERAPAVSTNANLAQAVAETALIVDDEEAACRVSDQLSVGRGEIYWLRLRAYCQARMGQVDAAQLTSTLANEKARDPVYARLMGAMLAGVGDPGAASLRNGLEYALSRRLALDLESARASASPAVARQLWPVATYVSEEQLVARSLVLSAMGTPGLIDTLLVEADAAPAKTRQFLMGRILLLDAIGQQSGPEARARLARTDAGKSAVAPNLLLGLDRAAALGLKGETALMALAIAADAGPAGPTIVDRARIISALRRVGLIDAAAAFAIEGLLVPAK